MRKKIFAFLIFILCFLFLILNFSWAQTAEDLYNRAVNKYFLGDNEGAISDLNEALKIDPNYTKAKALLSEIQKEIGKAPIQPPPMLAPTPPQPPVEVPKPTPKVTTPPKPKVKAPAPKAAPAKPAPPKPAPPPPAFLKYKPTTYKGLEFTWKDFLWVAVALLTLFYVVLRYAFHYIKMLYERSTIQVCSECKYVNPGTAEFCAKCGARLKPWTGVTAAQRKWYAKFGWKRNPFTLDIMPKLFTGYQTQVNIIFDKVYQKSGHILVTGKKGVGKTTLLKWLTETLSKEFNTVYIPRPTDNFEDLLQYMAKSLKLKKGKGEKITIYDMEALASQTNKNILLLLDEGHEFNEEFERPLRSLGDLNGINFVIAGLPETDTRLKEISPPFYDRIVQKVSLSHLSLEETTELIRKRIEDAGGSGIEPFSPEAIENVYKMSGGVPRLILKVCDWVITEAIHRNLDKIQVAETEGFPQESLKEEVQA